MMGSGGLIVMDEDNCMVDIAKFFLEFTVDESCGKCTPCRVGTKRLYELLCKVTDGTATMEDLDKMEELCYYIKENSLCGLGQTAPNPVLSTLHYFRDEYEAHVKEEMSRGRLQKTVAVPHRRGQVQRLYALREKLPRGRDLGHGEKSSRHRYGQVYQMRRLHGKM